MYTLVVKSFAGLIFLVVCLALALFGSAGSFTYWQAWLFLAVWTTCVVLITVYLITYDQRLLASRVQVGPTAETQKVQQIIQGLAGVCFIGLFIVAGLDFRFHWSVLSAFLSEIANVGVAIGFAIVLLVFRANSYTSATIEIADAQQVITSGPYRVVRHPMYAGSIILLFFTPLALGSWIALLMLVPLIVVIVLRLQEEETFLRVQLPGYEAYCHTVRYRLVPFIW